MYYRYIVTNDYEIRGRAAPIVAIKTTVVTRFSSLKTIGGLIFPAGQHHVYLAKVADASGERGKLGRVLRLGLDPEVSALHTRIGG